MKACITTTGNSLDGGVDTRFGRAQRFIVVDTGTGEFTVHDNAQNLNAVQGAGIQAAKQCADLGVDTVITGHIGPKAFTVLKQAGIAMYTGAAGTVQEALDAFRDGRLTQTGRATVDGHWT